MKDQLLQLAEDVQNGNSNALEQYIVLKRLENDFKSVMAIVRDLAIDEADKYGEKTFEAFGAEITKKSDPGRWNYKEIPQWADKKEQLKDIEELAKQSYNQKVKSTGVVIVDEDGIEIEAAQYTDGKSNISIKL